MTSNLLNFHGHLSELETAREELGEVDALRDIIRTATIHLNFAKSIVPRIENAIEWARGLGARITAERAVANGETLRESNQQAIANYEAEIAACKARLAEIDAQVSQ